MTTFSSTGPNAGDVAAFPRRATAVADKVWVSIALHTTAEILLHMEPDIALGIGCSAIVHEQHNAVVAAHPRPDFKNQILAAFANGLKARPATTFGNVKADVLAHFVPGIKRGDFVEVIQGSAWP